MTDYEIRVRRRSWGRWEWMVLIDGSGWSGRDTVSATRRGAIAAARRRIRRDKTSRLDWETVEKT